MDLILTGIGALVIEARSVGTVYEASREIQNLGSEIAASTADFDAVGTSGFDDHGIVLGDSEVPMGLAHTGQKIPFQLVHLEQAEYQLELTGEHSFDVSEPG